MLLYSDYPIPQPEHADQHSQPLTASADQLLVFQQDWQKPVVRQVPVHTVQVSAGSCWTGQYSDCEYPALLKAGFHLSEHVWFFALNRGVAWNMITLHSPQPSNPSPFPEFLGPSLSLYTHLFGLEFGTAMQVFTHIFQSQDLVRDYKSHLPLPQRDLQISMEHNCGKITAHVVHCFLPPAPKLKTSTSVQTRGWRNSLQQPLHFPHIALIRSEMLCRLQFKKVVNAPFIILLWVHLLQFCKGWTVPLMTSISPSALKANHNKQETILLLSLWSRVSRQACSCLKG